jgi:hypothetical protein
MCSGRAHTIEAGIDGFDVNIPYVILCDTVRFIKSYHLQDRIKSLCEDASAAASVAAASALSFAVSTASASFSSVTASAVVSWSVGSSFG